VRFSKSWAGIRFLLFGHKKAGFRATIQFIQNIKPEVPAKGLSSIHQERSVGINTRITVLAF
jgi:hypothetical protein